ncbi:MAG TPA: PilZ domain-containing protein [Nitrospirota bacterium]
MKKVLLANGLKGLFPEKGSILGRADLEVFTVSTNDEILKVHREKKGDLIITQLDLPGITTEELFTVIRKSEDLREVSAVIVCKDTLAHRERCKRCRANAVITTPVDPDLLHLQTQRFLNIPPRQSYRAALAVAIQGKFKDRPLPFQTEDISAGGMLIRAREPLSKGDSIFFSFFLPDGTHISGYGEIARVVWHTAAPDTFLYGIRFTTIDLAERSAIETAVEKMRS